MKKLLFLCIHHMPFLSFAQNVAINNDGSIADKSAILDVKSISKGLLIPRRSSAERLAINPLVTGLIVFDNTTASYWMYRGDLNGGWSELSHT